MAEGALCWYRVEFSADGKLDPYSIRAVDRAEQEAGGVFYVRASSAIEAGRLALRSYQLADNRRRRACYLAEGKCQWCGRPNDRGGKKRCSVCLAPHNAATRRYRAKVRGEIVETPSTKASRERNREAERTTARLEVLEEVRRWWAEADTPAAFARRLGSEIVALTGRKVA